MLEFNSDVSSNVSVRDVDVRNQEHKLNISGVLTSLAIRGLFNHAVLSEEHDAALIIGVRDSEVCHYITLCTLLQVWDVRGFLLKRDCELSCSVRVENVGAIALNTFFQ